MDDADLTPAERAEIERVNDVLADPAVWAEPPPYLQEAVVAAIAEEAGAGKRRRLRLAVVGVAAAVLLAVGVTVGVYVNRDQPVEFAATLSGTELSPDATGNVTLTKTPSGWDIRLHATGLPRREDGEYYQAWLKNDAGLLVPIGSFNDGRDVTLWSGVGPADFPTLTVTQEVAEPRGTIGVEASGKITEEDYRDVLVPTVEAALATGDVRLLYVLDEGAEYSAGAMWADSKLWTKHLKSWSRVAVVSDAEWLERSIHAFGWMMPGEIKVFEPDDVDDAKAWLAG